MRIKHLNLLYLTLLAGYLPCQLLFTLFSFAAFGRLVIPPTLANTAVMLGVVWFALHQSGYPIRRTFSFGKVSASVWIRTLLCAAALLLSKLLFQAMLPVAQVDGGDVVSQTLSGSSLLFSVLLLAVVPALGEEYVFRGVFYRLLREKTGIGIAALTSALYFAMMHFQLEHLFSSLLLGLCSALLLEEAGSLLPSLLLHFLVNSFPVLLTMAAQREDSMLTGFLAVLLALPAIGKGVLALLLAVVSLGLAGLPTLLRQKSALWQTGTERVTGVVTIAILAVWVFFTFVFLR